MLWCKTGYSGNHWSHMYDDSQWTLTYHKSRQVLQFHKNSPGDDRILRTQHKTMTSIYPWDLLWDHSQIKNSSVLLPMVGMVVTISPSLSLYSIVVLPAASRPTVKQEFMTRIRFLNKTVTAVTSQKKNTMKSSCL